MSTDSSKKPLLTIFLIVLVDLIGFGIVIPLLPIYADAYGATGVQIGWLMTVYSLAQFILSPVWGRVSDRIGRRPVLLASILGTALGFFLLGWAPTLTWLFIGRIVAGVATANLSTAYAYIADVTTEENRSKGMGLIGAAFGIGFVIGPPIGGQLTQLGAAAPMYFCVGLSLLNFVLAFRILKEPERAAVKDQTTRLQAMKLVFRNREASLPPLLFFVLTMAVAQIEVIFMLFMQEKFSYGAPQSAWLLGLMGLIMALVQGGAIGRLTKKYGEIKLLFMAWPLGAYGLYYVGASEEVLWTSIALSILAVGHGILHPTLSSLTSKSALENQRGLTMGVFHSMGGLARILGPLLAGYLWDNVSHTAPFEVAAGFMVLALLLSGGLISKLSPKA